jgi:hypothetical protein
MKGNNMIAAQCSCGFRETGDEQITDHLLAVFTPGNSTDSQGYEHLEGKPRTCLCGLTVASGGELDAHFLAVFTPADSVASDGNRHAPAT